MDLYLLISLASTLLAVILGIYYLQNKSKNSKESPPRPAAPVRGNEGIPRRAQLVRNQRNRLRNTAATTGGNVEEDADNEDTELRPAAGHVLPDEKIGAKKRAKLEAKAEKRIQREQELKAREEKKARDEKLEEERKKLEEKEAEKERKQEEAERLAKEERERKEHQEYMRMKAAFSVEEEGFDDEDIEADDLLSDFIQHIKDNKVVVLEDVAIHFKLKTQQVIDRITELQGNGRLTGVIDDRGKFIYITDEELLSVARFVKNRGRVAITELAQHSNELINLNPIDA